MAEEIGFRIKVQGASEQLKAMQSLKEELNSLALEKKRLNDASKANEKALKDETITAQEYEMELQRLAAAQVQNTIETKESSFEYSENEKAILSNNKAAKAQTGSLAQLRIELAQSKKEWTNLSAEERENEKVGGALLKTQQALDEEVRSLEKQIGVTSRNVGNYGEAVSAATPLMGAFGNQINQVQQTLTQIQGLFSKVTASTKANAAATKSGAVAQTALGTATKASATGFNLASKAAKFFKIALISTGIGAIVVLLGSLITAFATTQRGMDAVTRALAPLKEIFSTLFGLIQNVGLKVFDRLKAAINDPKQALKDLGNAIKENLTNRFTAAVDLIKLQGRAVVLGFRAMGLGIKKALANVPLLGSGVNKEQLDKDLAEVKAETIKVGKEIGTALAQVATGLDGEQQAALIASGKEYAAELTIAAQRGLEIDAITKEITRSAINLNNEVEEGGRLFEEQKKIAEDVLLSDGERLKAAQEAQKILKETEAIQIAQLDREIKKAKLETQANDTSDEEKKAIADLEAEKKRLQAATIGKSIELRNKENGIIQTRIKLNQKAQEDELKRIQQIEDEREKIAEKDKERALQLELELLDIKANQLTRERELEAASVDETDKMRIDKEIELQKQLTDLKIQAANKQAGALEGKEKVLDEKIKKLKLESKGAETVEILKLEDELNVVKQQKQKIQNEVINGIIDENRAEEQLKKLELERLEAEAELERLKQKEEFKQEVRKQSEEVILQAGQAFVDAENQRAARQKDLEISNLNAKVQQGLITQEEFEKEKFAIEKKAFNKKKAQDIAGIAISLAREIASINAAAAANPANAVTGGLAGVSQASILTGLAVARSAVQAGVIAAQSFAVGGFTGSGEGAPDSSGHKVAGVVHANEYVVPKKVLDSPQGAAMVGNLERMRLQSPTTNVSRGFVTGGFSSPQPDIDMKAFEMSISNSVISAVRAIPVVNNATDTASVSRGVDNIQNEVNF